eukprot:6275019-Pyramimonas_sp.AAC.1
MRLALSKEVWLTLSDAGAALTDARAFHAPLSPCPVALPLFLPFPSPPGGTELVAQRDPPEVWDRGTSPADSWRH